jgi:C4-dicarboxylate-specific signal transduction histidine kinase
LHQFNFVLSLFSSFTLFATANLIFWAAHKRSEKTKVQAMSNSRLLVLGDMAGGVAHEINNPLAIIQMRVEVLSRKLSSAKPPSSEEVIAQLVFIEKASFRIQRIVRSMNIFSKKSGDGPMRSTSLKKLFDETSDLCLEAMTKKLIKVQFTEVPDLQLVCYDTQLSQVILHIFNNAADAIENLEEKWIRVSFDVNDERLIIRFMDSGHGIHESIRQKIFDPFFTTKTVGKGTGLGLSISDSIMKTHGGEIRYQVVDNHTCFDLVFPIGSVASNVQARGVA